MTGYCASGVLAGVAERKLGVGRLLVLSSALVAIGLTGYALAPSWLVFFPIGFCMGIGSGAIDWRLNGFAARTFSARPLRRLPPCWAVGRSVGRVSRPPCLA